MRLTLRTMLAYLDDILDPADAKALGAKIDESEFATALVHRIRNGTRRLRLGAPKLDGKGMGLDPNTVAEYLDNTLPQDRVPDFEKVCLESDVHLAEVASCHQILTLVLGEPATVDPQLRDRIYHLPEQPAGVAAGAAAESVPVPGGNGHGAVDKPAILTKRPEVPDYLRVARRRSWKPIAATVTLALLLILAALLALGRFDESHPLLGRFFRNPAAATRGTPDRRASTSDRAPSATDDRERATVAEDDEGERGDLTDADPEETPRITVNVTETPADPATPGEPTTEDTAAPETSSIPPDSLASDAAEAGEATDLESTAITGTDPGADQSEPIRSPDEGTDGSASPDAAVTDTEGSADSAPDSTEPTTDTPEVTDDGSSPPSATEVGRFIAGDNRHVLGRLQGQQGWMRLPEREVLHAGDELVALPSYRPQIALTSGVQLTLVGPSRITLDSPDQMDAPVLRMKNATALLDTVGVTGSQIILELPDRRAQITFATPDATMAVQVHRDWPLGTDPLGNESAYACRIMATNGRLEWLEGEAAPISISAGQMLVATGTTAPELLEDVSTPEWVRNTELRGIELRASSELEAMIDPARSLTLNLMERIDHRQVEVAGLAIASLCAMEEFEPCLDAFRDDRFHSYWRSLYDRIQWALSGDVTAAERLLAALQKDRSDDAETLYKLTCGYSNAQLEAGDDKRLVSLLESRAMDVRVLAFENLRRIVGRTLNYRPEKDPAQQRRPLQDWQNLLEKKQIRWSEAAD